MKSVSETVLVRVSITETEHQNQKIKLGREGFIQRIIPHCCSSTKDVMLGTQTGQECGGRS